MSETLFTLRDGTMVFKGDILFHPDRERVGWYCIAEFKPDVDNSQFVTVRSPNGAVPIVLIRDLKREPPPPNTRCRLCGQLLPKGLRT